MNKIKSTHKIMGEILHQVTSAPSNFTTEVTLAVSLKIKGTMYTLFSVFFIKKIVNQKLGSVLEGIHTVKSQYSIM